MRTRTIYNAMRAAETILCGPTDFDAEPRGLNHRYAQRAKFQRELLRRMDELDALVAKAKAWDAFVAWATEPEGLLDSRERGWGEWMEIFTGWVGYQFPEVWPLAKPPYVRHQWYIDEEKRQ